MLNTKKTHGLLLHRSIIRNNLRRFRLLLRISKNGINWQNRNGDTPLLACLKRGRPFVYAERLLSAGANVMISNKNGISPLSFVIANPFYATSWLLRKSGDTLFSMYQTRSLNKNLYRVIKTKKYRLRMFVINRGFDNEKILVCVTTSNPLYSKNVVVRELNVFLDQMEADKNIKRAEFSHLCTTLIMKSMSLNTITVFKSVWNKIHHADLASARPTLLHDFVINSDFIRDSEFIECLHLILASRYAKCFAFCFRTHLQTFFLELFWRLRTVSKHDRMLVISRTVQLANVTIENVRSAYSSFGLNEEVVILLQHFQPNKFNWTDHFSIINFVMILENNNKLSVNGIANLDLVTRLSYRKLINSVPEELFANNENIKSIKVILNKVPTLFEMSRHVFQKSLQKFYNVQDLNQFVKTVRNLMYIPSGLKNNICLQPPIYYE